MTLSITLPNEGRTTSVYTLQQTERTYAKTASFSSRSAYSAAHVVADPLSASHPVLGGEVDWEATLSYRHSLWKLGFGVAEAMDTAQRGMGLTWETAKELIARSAKEAKAAGGAIASGAGTDHLDLSVSHSLDDIVRAYEEQFEFVEGQGSQVIFMASRALAKTAKHPSDYARVYGHMLSQVKDPVIVHWLGDMFDPNLAGYWGEQELDRAMDACLEVIHTNAAKIDGIKISLLDKEKEIEMRRKLPESVGMYTGDDFNYPELIAGDEQGYSHALLGIFDAIAPAAANALEAFDQGDLDTYDQIMNPTVPLARHIFEAPTYAYKTGIVFMAYVNGYQNHFRMIGGAEGARSAVHLAKLFQLADRAGLLLNPELAVSRMAHVLEGAGLQQEVLKS
ncbi:dihydrodipicolinate synthase family protein [Shouchella shacheensis]|uniref:dihydrodipicolinate synthase family protein n=1 Tax=Shouchella shacheensis TaxID=1649580 RepID=UPI00074034F0|nr:dihydrodipicolinate synthase family protein [Shouchella shacheensis]